MPYIGGSDSLSSQQSRSTSGPIGKTDYSAPLDVKTKTLTYSQANNSLLLDISESVSESASKAGQVKAIKVKNDGYVPAIAIFAYTKWAAEDDTSEAVEYIQYLLNPDEEITIPASRAIITTSNEMFDGTAVSATAPDSNEYTASGCLLDEGSNINTAVTNFTSDDGDYFRVGDLIRLDNEIMEITAISTNELYVIRAVDGSTAASHNDDVAIRFPFYNGYHDYDKYSVAQSDDRGRFMAQNFFGYGRTASGRFGLVPGSIAIQFYQAGYQKLGLSDLTVNTESGLTASTAYEFDIQVDGATNFDNLTFTTDSSNTKFGGSSGIIAKIQDALDTQYYTSGNLFQKKVHVFLENGDLVFKSGSYLSTSAIALTAGSTGAAEFFGTGRIPAVGSIMASVDARLTPEVFYDEITNAETYKNIFMRDDGRGNLIWQNDRIVGNINYETGAVNWTISERPNAEFVVSLLHTSPLSGKANSADADRANTLVQVLGNTPQQKCEAVLTLTTF